MNQFQIPADLSQILGKIHSGEGFSNFTADQWRIFFTIYATVSLWDHLKNKDQKILVHFVRICQLSVSRIVEVSSLNEVHQRLIILRYKTHSNTSLVLFFFRIQVLIGPTKFPIKDRQNTCKVYSFLVRSACINLTRKFKY